MYQVNLGGISPMLAVRRCADPDEFWDACDYCIDAPIFYPAGSTRMLIADGDHKASIATQMWREGA